MIRAALFVGILSTPLVSFANQAPTTKTVNLPKVGQRTYHFPSKFEHVDVMTASMLLPAKAVQSWLPAGMKPISLFGQARGRVTVQKMGAPPDGMKPYDEASFSVRVRGADGKPAWHTLEMPVNSLENKQRGVYIFGYPKEMADVSLRGDAALMIGAADSKSGRNKLAAIVDGLIPLPFKLSLKNHNLQSLRGKAVTLDSTARGKLRVGQSFVRFGEDMRARYPGLPESPKTYFGATMTDAELSLSLPERIAK
jgi:hypothetical protein